ncbi:MAG: superoxide dismutase family protein [Steroidobacteraceae bacterium]
MRSILMFSTSVAAVVLIAGCARKEAAPAADAPVAASTEAPAAPPQGRKVTALVALGATKGNKTTGTLALEVRNGVVQVSGQVSGLSFNADHGIHVHEKGNCKAPDASSAGGHFNPTGQPHGNPEAAEHHVGDIVNIHSDAMGNALVDLKLPGMTLKDGGPNDINKKAIVIHEQPDDYTTQPSGNSGARIACGVIG